MPLPSGIYDRLVDRDLQNTLSQSPTLRAVFAKLDPEEEPARYAAFLARVLEAALRQIDDTSARLVICNQVIAYVAAQSGSFLANATLIDRKDPILTEITPAHFAQPGLGRPITPLSECSLFTGARGDPQLAGELCREMASADAVDMLVSFIKWPGLRLLMEAVCEFTQRGGQLRIITTSYMGASDPAAVEWLANQPGTEVRVSYDTERTRLHAKAYHFLRHTGFSTAYIGSANLSRAAITEGLEWVLKVTAQDTPHVLEKFRAEFDTYWNSREFLPFDPARPEEFREAILRARKSGAAVSAITLFNLTPHPFQERILEALASERAAGRTRNLVVAATGTGKTVVSAFDFHRFFLERKRNARLLFVAHRREILEQALATFRTVLRDPNFGELLVGPHEAVRYDHLFCSIDMVQSRRLWERLGHSFYDFIVIDEAHHGTSPSYRPVFDSFSSAILLGLTATPERMDGQPVAADFGDRFAAEIRLPEALEEKLLCPFHYFGVSDPVSLDADRFWRSGKYDVVALTEVFTGAHALAQQRLDTILASLARYQPNLEGIRAVGFCVSVAHAEFMASSFAERGLSARALVGGTCSSDRESILRDFRAGTLQFLFTVDVLNEGLDVPNINLVLFLRPTESLTVFLQQLGRGLRHAPGKECLTVLDFVGQIHRRYQVATRFAALLPTKRFNLEREIEHGFPHLPPGCNIQLERTAREAVLKNIRENIRHLRDNLVDRLRTFEHETKERPTFSRFIRHYDYDAAEILRIDSWSGWKARAGLRPALSDPDRDHLSESLHRATRLTSRGQIEDLAQVLRNLRQKPVKDVVEQCAGAEAFTHYSFWRAPMAGAGVIDLKSSLERLQQNESLVGDFEEVFEWAVEESRIPNVPVPLPYDHCLKLHGSYSNGEIQAALGAADFTRPGQKGVGVIPIHAKRTYVLLVTFQKTEREFSPSTMYADYPVSRTRLHWDSQSNTAQADRAGQDLIRHVERGVTVLIFARTRKKERGIAQPFIFLGPGTHVSHEGERPIRFVWDLSHPMPVDLFEENRRGG